MTGFEEEQEEEKNEEEEEDEEEEVEECRNGVGYDELSPIRGFILRNGRIQGKFEEDLLNGGRRRQEGGVGGSGGERRSGEEERGRKLRGVWRAERGGQVDGEGVAEQGARSVVILRPRGGGAAGEGLCRGGRDASRGSCIYNYKSVRSQFPAQTFLANEKIRLGENANQRKRV
ncbi:hypothetical protein E2C01_031757 [Portunus trituberculatus]|uniref:Uncharacterized protein n=1 Tax=Portunus trituberculatus TaxID=210409 RepID=A0A5B7ETM4_PORTR|nr:hypothetical protein [Portunus trituberculatus]